MKVFRPETKMEACALLEDLEPPAVLVAGGTDLLVHWPSRTADHNRAYVDLGNVPELRGIRAPDAETLELGASTTYWDVVQDDRTATTFPLLVEAARQVGSIQIQARGTWAGNIANGSPAADGVPVLMAYDATLVLSSTRGDRQVALDKFYTGYKEMVMAPDELITAIRLPTRAHSFERFIKVGSRRAQAITKVGVAVAHSNQGWRVVANSVAPIVRRCPSIEAVFDDGVHLDGPEDLLPAILADVSPIDDLRSTAAYREQVLARVLYSVAEERQQ